jgi:DNA primase catalytic core
VRYAPEFLDELRHRVGLAELIGRHVKLQRRGREYVGLCPFHAERTPSFCVVEHEGFFHCFGCGAHGDAFGFVLRAEHVDFRAAVATLAAAAAAGTLRAARALPPNDHVAVELRERDERNRRIAWRLWARGRDPRGTLVEKYLRSRGSACHHRRYCTSRRAASTAR